MLRRRNGRMAASEVYRAPGRSRVASLLARDASLGAESVVVSPSSPPHRNRRFPFISSSIQKSDHPRFACVEVPLDQLPIAVARLALAIGRFDPGASRYRGAPVVPVAAAVVTGPPPRQAFASRHNPGWLNDRSRKSMQKF